MRKLQDAAAAYEEVNGWPQATVERLRVNLLASLKRRVSFYLDSWE